MKTKYIIATIVFICTLNSCKKEDNKKEEQTTAVVENDNKDFFSVEMEVISLKKDNFVVYFTEDNTLNYNDKNTVWAETKESNETQKVIFNLNEEVLPTDIRLDFGINKDQKEVILEKIEMKYYGKSFLIKGSDFLNFYNKNENIITEIDQTKGTIKFIQKPESFNPIFFYPNEKLLEEIKKITK